MEEAAARGWPLVRPTWLHHEDDAATLDLDRQFLMGADLLVAPVLAAGASTVRAYLPRGLWRRAFNGSVHNSTGEWLQAEAPLGKPAAWARLDPASREPRPSLVPFLQLASEADF